MRGVKTRRPRLHAFLAFRALRLRAAAHPRELDAGPGAEVPGQLGGAAAAGGAAHPLDPASVPGRRRHLPGDFCWGDVVLFLLGVNPSFGVVLKGSRKENTILGVVWEKDRGLGVVGGFGEKQKTFCDFDAGRRTGQF